MIEKLTRSRREIALGRGKSKNVTLSYTGYTKPTQNALTFSSNFQNSQIKYRFVEGVTQVRFAFGDFLSTGNDVTITPNLASSAERNGSVDVTYTARVYYGTAVDSNTAAFNPATSSGAGWASIAVTFFNGRTSLTLKAGSIAYSDWITLPSSQTVVMLRCAAVWSGTSYGGSFGMPNYTGGNFYNEIWAYAATDLTAGGSISYGLGDGSGAKTAIFAEGKVATTHVTRSRVLTIGDSRQGGAVTMDGTNYLCYSLDPINLGIARAGQLQASLNVNKSSERLQDLVAERWMLRPLIGGKCDYVVVQHGYNDLGLGAAAVLALYRAQKVRINDLGAKMICCTIYPNTTSSNTVKGSQDATRTAVNDAIRAASAVGDIHDGYLELADAIETDATNKAEPVRNGGFFIKPDGVYSYDGYVAASGDIYNDGTHTNAVGIEIIARKVATQTASVLALPSS